MPKQRREIDQHVVTTDERGAGNAYHKYEILRGKGCKIKFQKGPIKECGINGIFQEDLLVVVRDRLKCFQEGEYACRENEEALKHVNLALDNLNARTANREARGVEGTSEK